MQKQSLIYYKNCQNYRRKKGELKAMVSDTMKMIRQAKVLPQQSLPWIGSCQLAATWWKVPGATYCVMIMKNIFCMNGKFFWIESYLLCTISSYTIKALPPNSYHLQTLFVPPTYIKPEIMYCFINMKEKKISWWMAISMNPESMAVYFAALSVETVVTLSRL